MKQKIAVVIPAFNEENSVGRVVHEIPKDWVDEVIVVETIRATKPNDRPVNKGQPSYANLSRGMEQHV